MAGTTKPGVLRNLRIKRVDLVDMGANFDPITGDGAHIMLFKGGPYLGSAHVDSTDWRDEYEKATLDSASRNKLPDSAFAAVWTDAKGVKQRKLPIHDAGHLEAARGRLDAADIPANVKAEARRKIEAASNKEKPVKKSMVEKILGLFTETDVEKRNAAAALILKEADPDDVAKVAHDPNDPNCKCADCVSKAVAKAAKDKEEAERVAKAAEDAKKSDVEKKFDLVAKANADLEKRNSELAASIEVEKNLRLDREMVDILKSFKSTPFDLDKDVAEFRKMKESSPAAFERTMAILKATDAQLAQSALYKNIGSSRSGGSGDAWSEIEALADALMEKSSTEMTREKAIDKILFNPKHANLVKRYRAEQQ